MTPVIIKEVLGQEVYELFERYRITSSGEERSIKIWTNPEGKKLLEEALKKEYER